MRWPDGQGVTYSTKSFIVPSSRPAFVFATELSHHVGKGPPPRTTQSPDRERIPPAGAGQRPQLA